MERIEHLAKMIRRDLEKSGEDFFQQVDRLNQQISQLEKPVGKSRHDLGVFLLIILIATAGVLLVKSGPRFVGMVTYSETLEKELNLSISSSQSVEVMLSGAPSSLRVSGILIGSGNASIYLQTNDKNIIVALIKYVPSENPITGVIAGNGSVGGNSSVADNSSNQTTENASITQPVTPFSSVCVDSCSLSGVGRNITLVIEINNAVLNLTKLSYTIEKEVVEKPFWNSSVDSFVVNGPSYLNLSKYFVGRDLSYLVSPAENISLSINRSILDIVPAVGFIGERLVTLFASDFNSTVSKDITLVVNSSVGEVFLFANLSLSNVSNASFVAYPSRFVIRNSDGTAIAVFDSDGYLFLAGKYLVGQKDLAAAQGSFVIRDSNLNTIAYINSAGYLFLAGNIFSDVINLSSETGFQIRNSSRSVVALFDAQGNLKLSKEVNENYAMR